MPDAITVKSATCYYVMFSFVPTGFLLVWVILYKIVVRKKNCNVLDYILRQHKKIIWWHVCYDVPKYFFCINNMSLSPQLLAWSVTFDYVVLGIIFLLCNLFSIIVAYLLVYMESKNVINFWITNELLSPQLGSVAFDCIVLGIIFLLCNLFLLLLHIYQFIWNPKISLLFWINKVLLHKYCFVVATTFNKCCVWLCCIRH